MIGHFSYLDLNPQQRAHAAKRSRSQIQGLMTGSMLTTEQTAYLHDRLMQIDKWERGLIQIETHAPALVAKTPQHHTVGLSDTVEIDEKV